MGEARGGIEWVQKLSEDHSAQTAASRLDPTGTYGAGAVSFSVGS